VSRPPPQSCDAQLDRRGASPPAIFKLAHLPAGQINPGYWVLKLENNELNMAMKGTPLMRRLIGKVLVLPPSDPSNVAHLSK
jgi:hypothetical protein